MDLESELRAGSESWLSSGSEQDQLYPSLRNAVLRYRRARRVRMVTVIAAVALVTGAMLTGPLVRALAGSGVFAFVREGGGTRTVYVSAPQFLWRSGGPIIDLTRKGMVSAYGELRFTLLDVISSPTGTTLSIHFEGSQRSAARIANDFRNWVVIAQDAATYDAQVEVLSDTNLMVVTVSASVVPEILRAKEHLVLSPRPIERRLPLVPPDTAAHQP